MRYAFCLITFFVAAMLLQTSLFPALIPPMLQPDIGLLMGLCALAFGVREFGLIAIFTMGIQADLFGSARFGLLTLCYLLAAGIILWAAWRELTRGDLLAAWIGGVAATALAHGLYIGIGRVCGYDVHWGQAFAKVLAWILASVVWGLPVAWLCGKWMYGLNLMSTPVRERWAAEARLAAARRGKVMRG